MDLNPQDAEAFADLGLVQTAPSHLSEGANALIPAIQLKPDYGEAPHRFECLRSSPQDPDQLPQAAHEVNILHRRECPLYPLHGRHYETTCWVV